MPLQDLRQSYDVPPLNPADLAADPFDQFKTWFDAARDAGVAEANAMTLATVSADGTPAARTVLLKGLDAAGRDAADRGFVFYSNYESAKARDLAAHPRAALNFYWDRGPTRTVRVVGRVAKTSVEETRAYFDTRPRGSRIGAWCSHQSAVIPDRDVLEQRQRELEAQYPDPTPIPVPPFWGGYRVVPDTFEFWQGQPSRLHDRFRYRRGESGGWRVDRLSP